MLLVLEVEHYLEVSHRHLHALCHPERLRLLDELASYPSDALLEGFEGIVAVLVSPLGHTVVDEAAGAPGPETHAHPDLFQRGVIQAVSCIVILEEEEGTNSVDTAQAEVPRGVCVIDSELGGIRSDKIGVYGVMKKWNISLIANK